MMSGSKRGRKIHREAILLKKGLKKKMGKNKISQKQSKEVNQSSRTRVMMRIAK